MNMWTEVFCYLVIIGILVVNRDAEPLARFFIGAFCGAWAFGINATDRPISY